MTPEQNVIHPGAPAAKKPTVSAPPPMTSLPMHKEGVPAAVPKAAKSDSQESQYWSSLGRVWCLVIPRYTHILYIYTYILVCTGTCIHVHACIYTYNIYMYIYTGVHAVHTCTYMYHTNAYLLA